MIDERWAGVEKLLCVRLDTIGDVLLTTPAIRALKECLGAQITLLTSPSGAEIADLIPEVDDTMVYRAPWMKGHADHSAMEDLEAIERLSTEGFDAAVVFTTYTQSALPAALFCYLGGIPLRMAYARENPYQLLTDHAPEPEPHQLIRHEVQRHLDLVARVDCTTSNERISMAVPPESIAKAEALLRSEGVNPDGDWIAVHAGSTAPSRRYPAESFGEVATILQREHGYQVVLTGDASERDLANTVTASSDALVVNVAGQTTLAELAGMIKLAPLLISNNTAPVHIAAAVGTPVVDLYAMTNPQHTPWLVPNRVLTHQVPCGYCFKSICPMGHHACLREISPRDVADAAVELMPVALKEVSHAGK